MDERKLADLLRAAAADAPPSTFDHNDVARASERLRVRRRNGIVTGSAFGIAFLAGATALSVALWTGPDSAERTNAADSATAGGNENAAPYEVPNREDQAAPQTERGGREDSPPESRKQGRTSDGEAGPAGPGSTSSRCEQADRELAAALAGELPAAAPSRPEGVLPVRYECPPNMTTVTYQLADGTVSAFVLDPGAVFAPAREPGTETEQARAATADGRMVVIVSSASGSGPPPYADQLDEWATRVALRY